MARPPRRARAADPAVGRSGVVEPSAGLAGRVQRCSLRVGPFPIRWVAVYRDFIDGRQFADEQADGPFTHWRHLHRFDPAGTRPVRYRPDRVRPSARSRRRVAARCWSTAASSACSLTATRCSGPTSPRTPGSPTARRAAGHHRRDRPARPGAFPFLTTGGHRGAPLTVRGPPAGRRDTGTPSAAARTGHARRCRRRRPPGGREHRGERWTAERKRRIRESRVTGTRSLARRSPGSSVRRACWSRPRRSASTATAATRSSPRRARRGPRRRISSSDLAREWEAAAEPARAAGSGSSTSVRRRAQPAGGALAKLLLPFRLGRRRAARQRPAVDELGRHGRRARRDASCAAHRDLSGPVNVPPRSRSTNRVHRGPWAGCSADPPLSGAGRRAPAGSARWRTSPSSPAPGCSRRLAQAGYVFRYPQLEAALRYLLGTGE